MNLAVRMLEIYTPSLVKKRQVRVLFEVVAEAFECETPLNKGLPYDELLYAFAHFTNEKALGALEKQAQERDRLKQNLHQKSFELGARLRTALHLRKQEDIQALIIILYRNIAIDLEGHIPGDFAITSCYFARLYTPAVCGFIAALDEGIMAGLSGGGSLCFQERISEGKACCKARFSGEEFSS